MKLGLTSSASTPYTDRSLISLAISNRSTISEPALVVASVIARRVWTELGESTRPSVTPLVEVQDDPGVLLRIELIEVSIDDEHAWTPSHNSRQCLVRPANLQDVITNAVDVGSERDDDCAVFSQVPSHALKMHVQFFDESPSPSLYAS